MERAARFAGPLLDSSPENDEASPLAMMAPEERLVADFNRSQPDARIIATAKGSYNETIMSAIFATRAG